MFPLVPRGSTGSICLKSRHKSIQIPPIGWMLPVKSFRVRSRASNARLLVTGASFTTMALASWMTLQSAVPLLMLQTGMSIASKFKRILKVLCKVRPPVKSVAAIPLDAVANAILPSDLILARIRLIKKVPPKIVHLPDSYQPWNKIMSYTSRWSTVNKAALCSIVYSVHRLAVNLGHSLFPCDTPLQTYHCPLTTCV